MSLQAFLTKIAHNTWRRKGILSGLLLPFAWLVGAYVKRKHLAYQTGARPVFRSNLPVIVVGNIYVGGTGKTPVVIALVQALQKQGWSPGVISRGYGVTYGDQAITGCGQLDAHRFGDEPAQIAEITQAPVAVHPQRALAAKALQRDFPQVDVIVSDDGLQHLALGRDIEIVVQDGRGIGNGRLLPAGPLREPAKRLLDVDFIIYNLPADQLNYPVPPPPPPTSLTMHLAITHAVHLLSGETLHWPEWLSLHQHDDISAVAAIGQPQRFFNLLISQDLRLHDCIALPDHYAYDASPFTTLQSPTILLTAKDAVKCSKFDDKRLWAVHVQAVFSEPDWLATVHKQLTAIVLQQTRIAANDG